MRLRRMMRTVTGTTPRDIELPQEGRRDPKLPPLTSVRGQLGKAAEGYKALSKRGIMGSRSASKK